MEEELFTLKDIALQLDLPESTLRKYRDAFPEFIPTVGSGRDRRYTADAADVFSTIRACRTDEHLSWEDTSEHLAQKFPIDTDAGARGEPPPSVAERVPAAIQTATTLKKMEKEGAEQSFLLTTIGAELVKLSRGVDRITGAMDDLGVLRRTVLSQDNQIRNLSRIVAASLEDMQAWRQERAELQQIVAEKDLAQKPAAEAAPAPNRQADEERRRDLYAVLDRLGQLQSSMSFVVKQFERKTLDIEKKYEQINAIPTPAPTASAPAPGMDVAAVTEIQERHKEEIHRLRALLKERDEEITQLQGANRRLRIETDALKSRVSEMSRIEPAAPAPILRPPTLDHDKMAGGKLFFRGKKK
jgi:regulator of replication initiation timing